MDFKKQKPIYRQIADTICRRIVDGEWDIGERIPSVRDIAVQLGVNPNTVMRAFDFLQNGDIIHMRRGMGYYVSDEAVSKIAEMHRQDFLTDELPELVQKMKLINLTFDDLKKICEDEKF